MHKDVLQKLTKVFRDSEDFDLEKLENELEFFPSVILRVRFNEDMSHQRADQLIRALLLILEGTAKGKFAHHLAIFERPLVFAYPVGFSSASRWEIVAEGSEEFDEVALNLAERSWSELVPGGMLAVQQVSDSCEYIKAEIASAKDAGVLLVFPFEYASPCLVINAGQAVNGGIVL